ncbi:unnamed protein product, partial [Brassica oleracea]
MYMFPCGIFTKLSSVFRSCLVLTISSHWSPPSLRSPRARRDTRPKDGKHMKSDEHV